MKKRVVTIILLFSMLCAYDLGMGGLGQYTIFDPHLREPLLSYPTSWLKPSQELFDHNYQDSSSTYAKWERFFALGFKSSNNIIAKYTPFHRRIVGVLAYNLQITPWATQAKGTMQCFIIKMIVEKYIITIQIILKL